VIIVRHAKLSDTRRLLEMMKLLAEFEGYIDDFKVTQSDIIEHGFGVSPLFTAFVASFEEDENLQGMAVTYSIPWTYDLKPVLVLKELFVAKNSRGRGVGHALFKRVKDHAADIGVSKIEWTVLKDNDRAKEFYQAHDGHPDPIWESWLCQI